MSNQELNINNLGKKIINIEKRISRIERVVFADNAPKIKGKALSIKEFLLTKELKDDGQKILAIAYFLEKYDGLTSFNVKDLATGFARAKEKAPRNLNDRINKIIGKTGYVMETREKKNNLKAWQLTNSGERFIEKSLPAKEKS